MEHCSKKIEELLKDKLCINSENDENNYLVKKLLNNVVDIVKLTNRLSLNCLYKNGLDIISNNLEIKDLKNNLLKTIYDLLLYSSSDKTKNILKISYENDFSILQNNYHIISSILEDIFNRSNDCFRFFDVENKDKSIFTCKYLKNLNSQNINNLYNKNNCFNENIPIEKDQKISIKSQNVKDEEEKKKKKKKDNKIITLNELEEKENENKSKEIINVNQYEDQDKIKEEIEDNNINSEINSTDDDGENEKEKNNFKEIIIIENENEKKENYDKNSIKNSFENVKKVIDKNSKKNKSMFRKKKKEKDNIKKNNIFTVKGNLHKVQNSWLHLTNNYAKFFIPRILFKYNKLMDLDQNLKEAVKVQEYYIKKKKLLLYYHESFKNNELKYSSSEIIDEIFNDNELNEMSEIKNEETYNINSYCSTECSSVLKYNGVIDEDFFSKMLKKLHKDINKYYYRFYNLSHPYEYEINNIIQLYKKGDKDILKFLEVNYELTNPLGINEKKYEVIDNKDDLIKMINTIKLENDRISIMVRINYKKSYRGFVSLILVGTKTIDYIIDVFNMFEDIFLLNEITTDPRILKITYDLKNVILFLQKDFSVYLVNAIDILICSNYLNLKNTLSNLVHNYFNVNVNSIRSYSNFLTRPLTPDVINILRSSFYYLYYLFDYVKIDLYFNYIFNSYKNDLKIDLKQEDLDNNSKDEINNEAKIYREKVDKNEIKNIENCSDKNNKVNDVSNLEVNVLYDNDIINKKNIYVNFEKIKFYDLSEHEKKYGEEIMKKVFIDSNNVCLTKIEIKEVCDIIKTNEQIKKIIKNSYNSNCCDNLINNLLVWRENLSKKVDEPPDNIINIHNIISIILNMPTSISSLKNNIVPLSNVISENLETLFEIITKSNIKKPNSHFYLNYIQNDTANNNCIGEEITPIKYSMNNKKINNENYKDSIILPNLYFQSICQENKIQSNEQNFNHLNSQNIIQYDQQNVYHVNSKKATFALEKTFFSESEEDNMFKNKNNNTKNESYILLSSLINSMKERNEKISKFNQNKHIKKITTEVPTKKSIDKKKKKNNNSRKKKKTVNQSYNQQYNIKKSKVQYSKNILNEMN
ncbi:exosome complex exonuclease RRP6, putative [Plasmodium relictum]|uniref:Exosome complex exonuclease RRP6, putative n=1 Tax=Plasmodium relictum TaxID=85471 RepID=A0A1J1HDC9_PLARL|nr:exosome complex exonuclease RRP6, putative [Plasmodium relictum]CRH01429.1 exosome complex exonuclease RRP6, putative [Plasmodium relictum]